MVIFYYLKVSSWSKQINYAKSKFQTTQDFKLKNKFSKEIKFKYKLESKLKTKSIWATYIHLAKLQSKCENSIKNIVFKPFS